MTTTKVTTLADLFWVAANEYLTSPEEEESPDGRKFSCIAVLRAANAHNIDLRSVGTLLTAAGVPRTEPGWYPYDDTRENNQLARYTFLLFLSLYCENEGI